MRYRIEEIENQIIATLHEETALATVSNIKCHASDVNRTTFLEPSMGEGYVSLLPFVLVQYQGRTSSAHRGMRDSSATLYIHELRFRLYAGAQSLRTVREGQLSAYDMNAAVYDALHGKFPSTTIDHYPNSTKLDGPVMTVLECKPLTPIKEAPGISETIVVNMRDIVVYASDWIVDFVA